MKVSIREEEWQAINPFIAHYRPRKHELKDIVSGIVWILRTGAQWRYLPQDYPPKSSCYYWYRKMLDDNVFVDVFNALVGILEEHGKIDLEECSVDATFIRARVTLEEKGKTKCGKGHKLMAIVDKKGKPIALHFGSASPHELKLLQPTISNLATDGNPKFLLADKAYDCDATDQSMKQQSINLISPHRKNRKKPKTQDGRHLRRYKHRWKIEQFFAHLHNFRKITLCYEKYSHTFFGFIQIATLILLINKL